jgi:hypothetical protein
MCGRDGSEGNCGERGGAVAGGQLGGGDDRGGARGTPAVQPAGGQRSPEGGRYYEEAGGTRAIVTAA